MENILAAESSQQGSDCELVLSRVSVWFSKAISDQRCYRIICQCGRHKLFLLPQRLQVVGEQAPQLERPFKEVSVQLVRFFFQARRRGQCVLDLLLEEQQKENDRLLF